MNTSGPLAGTIGGKRMKGKAKVEKVMGEFKRGKLHSGSSAGPKVKSRKQAVAIALSEAGQSKKGKRR
jgi:hypothetical protein